MAARRFPRGGVAAPHYLASTAGLVTLARGGNAIDAAIAANLALGVVAPYLCGYGGGGVAGGGGGGAPRPPRPRRSAPPATTGPAPGAGGGAAAPGPRPRPATGPRGGA